MRLTVAIRTRDRIHNQLTLSKFFLEKVVKTVDFIDLLIVVPECNYAEYSAVHPWTKKYLRVVPDDYKSGSIFQFLLDTINTRYTFCIDDDLQLDRRRDPISPSQKGATGTFQDACDVMHRVVYWINRGFVHGGISLRPYNFQVVGETYKECVRICRAMFWDSQIIKAEGLRFDDVQSRSDFHMWLSLLERGYANVCDYEFMVGENGAGKADKGGTNTPGGCSRYRTPEFQLAEAERLQRLHPESVTVIYKTKVSPSAMKMAIPGLGIPDVRIQWARALGIKRHLRKYKIGG